MIHFLHDFRYWTEYLHPYLDPARFSLLRSKRSDGAYPAPRIDPANRAHRDIVVAGHSNEVFGAHTRVLARLQHSPGFGCEAFLHAYRWIHNSPRRMMIPSNVLELLRTTRLLAPAQLPLRDQLLKNPKLLETQFDPSLNQIYRAPRTGLRVPGSVLVSLNWRISLGGSDMQRAIAGIKTLARDREVRVVTHPFSNARWIGVRHHDAFVAACREARVHVATEMSRKDLLIEFDRAEFVLSDGSGSCYEAVARGCKALLLGDLSYHRGTGILSAAFAAGHLPPTPHTDLERHPGIETDLAWLKRLFPKSIVEEDIASLAADELVQAFERW